MLLNERQPLSAQTLMLSKITRIFTATFLQFSFGFDNLSVQRSVIRVLALVPAVTRPEIDDGQRDERNEQASDHSAVSV